MEIFKPSIWLGLQFGFCKYIFYFLYFFSIFPYFCHAPLHLTLSTSSLHYQFSVKSSWNHRNPYKNYNIFLKFQPTALLNTPSHTYIQTHKQTGRQPARQKDTQTHKYTQHYSSANFKSPFLPSLGYRNLLINPRVWLSLFKLSLAWEINS